MTYYLDSISAITSGDNGKIESDIFECLDVGIEFNVDGNERTLLWRGLESTRSQGSTNRVRISWRSRGDLDP